MQAERHRHILTVLRRTGQVTIAALARDLAVNALTIRRDLQSLHDQGRLMRTHGGAVLPDFVPAETSFDRKRSEAAEAKRRLVPAACGLAHGARAVFIDAGSTTFEIGLALLRAPGPLLYTNSIPLLMAPEAHGRVVALGGLVRSVSLALVGTSASSSLENLSFDVAFIGASGVHNNHGPATTEPLEAAVKREAIARSSRPVLVLDGSKWSRQACLRFASWRDFRDIVTDHTPRPLAQRLRALRVALHLTDSDPA